MKTYELNLNELTKKYETKDFIKNDPIQFPHRFSRKKDIEIVGFIASLLSYGSRKAFITELEKIFLDVKNPVEYIKNFEPDCLRNFNYRFTKSIDLIQIFLILKEIYTKNSTLEEIFKYGYAQNGDLKEAMSIFVDYFYARVTLKVTKGFYHLLPNPRKNSACKRLNMFLRWMVRNGDVDFGIWNFIDKSALLIPLDVHVARISRQIGLLNRKSNDFQAVIELTNELKKLDFQDPVKYDFAMFGFGIDN